MYREAMHFIVDIFSSYAWLLLLDTSFLSLIQYLFALSFWIHI